MRIKDRTAGIANTSIRHLKMTIKYLLTLIS